MLETIDTEPSRRSDARQQPLVLHTRVITGVGGGPDKTILNSARYLRRHGFRASSLFLRPPEDPGFQSIRERSVAWESPIIEVDDTGPLDWKIVPRIANICRDQNVTVWHAHDYKTNLLGLLLARTVPMRLVTTVHGWVEHTWRTRLYHRLDRWTMPRYERVVCVSPDLLDKCRRMGVSQERSLLIENAIDCEQFSRRQSRPEAKQRLGLPADRPVIGAVGRLSPEKGFDRLISAAAELIKRGRRLTLVILGGGAEQSRLESQIRQLGLRDSVRLAGFQSDTISWYEAMDLFALSSLREGLPNVVLEAMALETPVVATRVAGVPRVIEDGRSGLVVPIGDDAALVDALDRLLGDESLRADLAAEGRRVIEDRYSFAARMEKMARVYESIGVLPAAPPVESQP